MDRKNWTSHLKKGRTKSWLAVIAAIAFAWGTLTAVAKSYNTSRAHDEAPKGAFASLVHTYVSAWNRVQDGVDELRRADEENDKLRLENAHLRLVLESRRFECYAERAETMTRDFEMKLNQETLSRTGRTLASIAYKVPTDLMPKELYSLALSYFRNREDEKAAVIFTFLTGMEEEDTFKTPANLLMTGIAWYRLEHFEKAEFYFDRALKHSDVSAGSRFAEQARLWRGMVSERTGKHTEAQAWLREVLNKNPHSIEAGWVNNPSEHQVKRETASEQ